MTGYEILASLLTLLAILSTLRLRARASALATMPASSAEPAAEHTFVVRNGVQLDEATKRAASAYALAHDLQVLDIVSARLSCWRSQLLLDTTDPGSYRKDRVARGATAGDALLVTRALSERAGVRAHTTVVDAAALLEVAGKLKRYAVTGCDLAVAPSLAPSDLSRAERRQLLRIHFGGFVAPLTALTLVLLGLSLAFAPAWGLAALAALHLQYVWVTWGTALRPHDRVWASVFRPLVDIGNTFGPVAKPAAPKQALRALRATYDELLARGTDHFFEARRSDCPVCGGQQLKPHVRSRDRLFLKPGFSRLERCAACRHIFQNPRLSLEGLAFYYRDAYDGVGEAQVEGLFAAQTKQYRERVQMVCHTAQPRRWLDVGAGHGHFCCTANELLPDTRFEGLDFSDSIEEAARRGWIARGIRGLFPDLAHDLAEQNEAYDVVSMSHYLEHVLDPRAELAAAAQVLPKGGVLFIEVPDPESRLGWLLGSFWAPWFQPQHLNFLSVTNLERMLREHAFEPLAWQRGNAHISVDFTAAAYFAIVRVASRLDLPWLPEPSLMRRVWHLVAWCSLFPLIVVGWLLDRLLAPALRRPGWSNTYRVVARKADPQLAAA